MPKGDRTGPVGTGARSGRAAGFCTGFNMPGYAHPRNAGGAGRRAGRRRGGFRSQGGGGREWCSRPFATGRLGRMAFGGYGTALQPLDPELERQTLRNRSQALQSELDAVNRRLTELQPEEQTS
jgi:hypothetical protein